MDEVITANDGKMEGPRQAVNYKVAAATFPFVIDHVEPRPEPLFDIAPATIGHAIAGNLLTLQGIGENDNAKAIQARILVSALQAKSRTN